LHVEDRQGRLVFGLAKRGLPDATLGMSHPGFQKLRRPQEASHVVRAIRRHA